MTISSSPCPVEGCDRTDFVAAGALTDHLRHRHRWDPAQIDEHFASPVEFQCPHCPRTFKNFHGRQVHIARTHGENAVSKKPAAPKPAPALAIVDDDETVDETVEPKWVEYSITLDAALSEQVEAWCWLNRCELGEQIGVLLEAAIAGDRRVAKLVRLRAEAAA